MKKWLFVWLGVCIVPIMLKSQQSKPVSGDGLIQRIDPSKVTIIRDSYGVPYIYGDTDAEVAYGLAWANAEDDFASMQENLLTAKAMLGLHQGKDGAGLDFIVKLFKIREHVFKHYAEQVSDDFKRVLEGYAQAVNEYASTYPHKVFVKKAFPILPQDVLCGYVATMTLFSQAPFIIQRIFDGTIDSYRRGFRFRMTAGSNAIAVAPSKTDNGHTFLAINSHQPLEGRFSWYEAELHSKQGWNIHGGLFPGGATIFLGFTPNFAWAHTFNLPDICDHYKLTINPKNSLQYEFDGKWVDLEPHTIPLEVKIAGFVLKVKKKAWWSVHGPVIKGADGEYYAIRAPATTSLRVAEQWFRMNKAQNFEEFQKAVQMHAAALFNLIYADNKGNIYYHHLGLIPKRKEGYDWNKAVPGNTSETLWSECYALDDLPHYLNPSCGYLFNTNNTACFASCPDENLPMDKFSETMGLECYINNRAQRLFELIQQKDKISWNDFLKMKYDLSYSPNSNFIRSINAFWELNPEDYPDLKTAIQLVQNFDFEADSNDYAMSYLGLAMAYIFDKYGYGSYEAMNGLPKCSQRDAVEALRYARRHLLKYFKKEQVRWGDLMRHRRGNVDLAYQGAPEVLSAALPKSQKDGRFKSQAGESLIMLIDYETNTNNFAAYTINAYGSSADPKSPHYTDQMHLFVKQQTRKIPQNTNELLNQSQSKYSPNPKRKK